MTLSRRTESDTRPIGRCIGCRSADYPFCGGCGADLRPPAEQLEQLSHEELVAKVITADRLYKRLLRERDNGAWCKGCSPDNCCGCAKPIKTVVLCGSIDHPKRLRAAAKTERAMGHTVLMPDDVPPGGQPSTEAMDRHHRRIEEADEVVVVVGEDCRIGHHVAREIWDATCLGDKVIRLRMELLK